MDDPGVQGRLQAHAAAVWIPKRAALDLGRPRHLSEGVDVFGYAKQIKEPLLLIRGDADDRAGTLPMQSEPLYQAHSCTNGQTSYVLLLLEAHGYSARESVGHMQWEIRQWLRTHLGDPKAPR